MCFNLRYIAFKKSNLQWKSVEKCDSSLWEIIPLNSWFWQQTFITTRPSKMEVYHRQPFNGDLTIRFHINRFEQGYQLDWIGLNTKNKYS